MEDKERRVELERIPSNEETPLARPGYPRAFYPPDVGGGYGYGYPEQKSGLNWRTIWRTVYKRKWLILVLTLIVTSVATVEIYRTKSTYRATASIEIRRDTFAMAGANILVQANDLDTMNTYLYTIKSRPLLMRVAADLKLDQNPNFFDVTNRKSIAESIQTIFRRVGSSNAADPSSIPPANLYMEPTVSPTSADLSPEEKAKWSSYAAVIASGIEAQPVQDARLILISYTHTDPVTAAFVANSVANHFIDENFRAKTAKYTKTSDWIETTTRKLEANLQQAEREMADYLSRHDLAFLSGGGRAGDNGVTLGSDKFFDLNKKVQEAENNRVIKESLYEQVKKGNVTGLPQAYADQQIDELQKRLRELKIKETQLAGKFGNNNPTMITLRAEIATVQTQLEDSVKRLAAKLQVEYENAVREEKLLKQQLANSKVEADKQNRDEIEYNTIKSQVETQRKLYNDFLEQNTKVELQKAEQSNNIRVAEQAEAPVAPVGPQRFRTIITWFLLSLAGGIGLAFFLESLDNTIKTVEDITNYAQLPALGVIPAIGARKVRSLTGGKRASPVKALSKAPATGVAAGNSQIIALDTRSTGAEAYRALRTSVMLSSAGGPPKRVLVTSGQPGEGKTTTTINTAVSLSQLGASVVIVDCDLRKPSTHKVFGLDHSRGVSTYLSRDVELDSVIQKLPIANLSLIPCGPIPPNPAELISSDRMKEMLKQLSERYDHILIDSPPLMHVTDPVILSTLVDGVILVVHAGKSTRDLVRRSRQELSSVGAKIFGVVLNNVDFRSGSYDDYYYYRYYDNYYGSDKNEAHGD
ncbi:MAG: polysaccharide biosynthesis tyrosine autokinase [Acidobacteriota bacterium]